MYTKTLQTPIGTEVGGALTKISIAGIIRWSPVDKKIKISVRYGVTDGENVFIPSSRREDNYAHEFLEASYDYIVAAGITDELGLWDRMYEKLGEERTEALNY